MFAGVMLVAAVPRGGRGSQQQRHAASPSPAAWRPSHVAAEDRNPYAGREGNPAAAGGGRPSWRPRIATQRPRVTLHTTGRVAAVPRGGRGSQLPRPGAVGRPDEPG